MISMQTQQRIFFWGLNVEALDLNQNSPMEEEGLEKNDSFNARDRFVKLEWSWLYTMLQKVISYKRDVISYRALYGEHGTGVVWRWENNTLTQEPPIFCSECPVQSSLECKKC